MQDKADGLRLMKSMTEELALSTDDSIFFAIDIEAKERGYFVGVFWAGCISNLVGKHT